MRSQVRFRLLVIAAIAAFSLVLSACGAPARAPAAMDAAVSGDSAPAVAYEMAEAAAEMPAGAPLDRKIIGTASIDLVVADTSDLYPARDEPEAGALSATRIRDRDRRGPNEHPRHADPDPRAEPDERENGRRPRGRGRDERAAAALLDLHSFPTDLFDL